MRFIIIEDNPFVSLHIACVLEDMGHEICEVDADYKSAMTAIEHHMPDLLTVDVGLPTGGSGLRVARDALHWFGIRSVIITGTDLKEMALPISDVAPVAVLTKPCSTAELAAAFAGLQITGISKAASGPRAIRHHGDKAGEGKQPPADPVTSSRTTLPWRS